MEHDGGTVDKSSKRKLKQSKLSFQLAAGNSKGELATNIAVKDGKETSEKSYYSMPSLEPYKTCCLQVKTKERGKEASNWHKLGKKRMRDLE